MTDSTLRLRGEGLTLGYGKKIIARDAIRRHSGRPLHRHYRAKRLRQIDIAAHAEPPDDAGTSGQRVSLDGEQNPALTPAKRWRSRIGLLAQNATTPGDITVQELVARGRYPHQPLFYPLAQGGRRGRHAARCRPPASPTSPSKASIPSPAASASARGSPWCWPRRPPSCCWTSPPPGWISAIRSTCWSC